MTPQEAERCFADLIPNGAQIAWRDPRQLFPLLPREMQAMTRARPKRRAEFSAGRGAARAALGMPGLDLPPRANRAPDWPKGYRGSISHSPDLCAALVGPAGRFDGLGLDIEAALPLDLDLHSTVLRPDEQPCDPLQAMMIFSAKEALYKAMSPHLPGLLEFHDAEVTLAETGPIAARLTRDAGLWANGTGFEIKQALRAGQIVSICAILPNA